MLNNENNKKYIFDSILISTFVPVYGGSDQISTKPLIQKKKIVCIFYKQQKCKEELMADDHVLL